MCTRSRIRQPVDVYRFEAVLRRAAWAWLGRRIAAFVAKARARRTVRELSALSERDLQDVGLLRADICAAAARSARFERTDKRSTQEGSG
jgi:uncharacterized protein YjiS (DUF1127 family)